MAIRLVLNTSHDEEHYIVTKDNVKLGLLRYLPSSENLSGLTVILCHGIGSNRFTFDAGKISLARYLRDMGMEVWITELRGRGFSEKPGGRLRWKWNFDTLVNQDVPAVLDYVHKKSGMKKIVWIGHNTGGMLMYAYLGLMEDNRIKKVITLGSPVSFDNVNLFLKTIAFLRYIIFPIRRIPLRNFLTINTQGLAWFLKLTKGMFFNHKNMNREIFPQIPVNIIENESSHLIRHFGKWITRNKFTANQRKNPDNYSEFMRDIDTPFLICSGASDRFITPESVHRAYNQIGSIDKKYLNFGRETDFSEDYGHFDMLLGQNADKEVFPCLAKWIKGKEN